MMRRRDHSDGVPPFQRYAAFGKRQGGTDRAQADVRDFAQELGNASRRQQKQRTTRTVIMIGALVAVVVFTAPFIVSAINSVQIARADLKTFTVEDVSNFMTAAGDAMRRAPDEE